MPISSRATVSVLCKKNRRAGFCERLTARDGKGILYNAARNPPNGGCSARAMRLRIHGTDMRLAANGWALALASLAMGSAAHASVFPLPTDGTTVVGRDT